MATSPKASVENFKSIVGRFIKLPLSDWSDHLRAQRYDEAVMSVNVERLKASFVYALDTASRESGASPELVKSLVRWDMYQELVDKVAKAQEVIASVAEVEGFGAQVQAGIRFAGDVLATTAVGQMGAELLARGVGKLVESELNSALTEMQVVLEGYAAFVDDTVEVIASTPGVLAALEHLKSRRQLLLGTAIVGSVIGLGAIIWATFPQSNASATESAPSATAILTASASVATTNGIDAATPVPAEPAHKRLMAPTQKSQTNRADCIKKCVNECNDDSACEHSCVAKRCR
jgi:hypothetical protein